ncbi:Hint domain-containing protein [Tabrizicola sp. DMG-N-6]|uniref:Hint domain-containing protein n=2 Tax=Szabonella alba TaxID=2804194 RepID=A0A8K0VA33_9RHOB|nr:Hint domain-containing protein [Szabonella alba]
MLSYQETPGGQPQYFGYVTTIPVEPGDSITLSFATGNNPNVPYSSLVCFCRNTLIRTGSGQEEVLIEDLSAGDNVLTRDHGVLPIRWIGSRHISTIDLLFKPNLRPVRVKAGALGDGLPRQDLLVSRQHRFLLRSPIVQELLGTDEALVPAIKLVGLKGIEIAHDVQEVEYFHILFDQHEVICANGAWTESLFTGPEALKSVSPEARAEIETLFPEICSPDHTPAPARVIPDTGKLMKQIVARHKSGGQPVYVG